MIPADSSSSQETMTPSDTILSEMVSKKTPMPAFSLNRAVRMNIFKHSKSWIDVMDMIIAELEEFISRAEFTDEYIANVITKRLVLMHVLDPIINKDEEKYFFDERLKLLEIDEFDCALADLRVIAVQILEKLWEFHNIVSQLLCDDISPVQEVILNKCFSLITSMEESIGDEYLAAVGSSVPFNPNINEFQVRSMDFFYDGLFYSGPVEKIEKRKVSVELYNPNGGKYFRNTYQLKRHIEFHVHNFSSTVKSNIKSFILDTQMLKFFIQKDSKLFGKTKNENKFYY